MDAKTEDFYQRLQTQLEQDTSWPSPYLFKFIVPSIVVKVEKIKAIFSETEALITTKDSSKGTYTSVSIKLTMASPEAVIIKYREVSLIEGVISL